MGHGSPNSFAIYRRQASRLQMSDDGAALIAALRERVAERRSNAICLTRV